MDETVVNTDYVIEPITVFKERVAVTTARTPGPTFQLLVRRPGGEIMDQGMRLITYAHPYPEKEPFVQGDEVICFLTQAEDRTLFHFTEGPFGLFRIRNGRVHALTEAVAELTEFSDTPLADFMSMLNKSRKDNR